MNTADVSFLHHLNRIEISRVVMGRHRITNKIRAPLLALSCISWSPVISVVVIKLSIINDICQAIACSSDYFHCVVTSQVTRYCHTND